MTANEDPAAAQQVEAALKATLDFPSLPQSMVIKDAVIVKAGDTGQVENVEAPEKEETEEQKQKEAPLNTFEKMPFEQLIGQYNKTSQVAPSLELSQAFLMTSNMRYGAGQVSAHTPGGVGYFFQSDYVGDTMRLQDSLGQIGKLVSNLGPADKSTNFILEQRNLMRSQANEDRDIREAIQKEIVDGLEYVRTKEKIALTKQRVKKILEDSDSDSNDGNLSKSPKKSDQDTEEDSQKAYERHRLNQRRIHSVIRQLRRDARTYLGLSDSARIPLSQIYFRLNRSKEYKRKRAQKALRKGVETRNQLDTEVNAINKKLQKKLGKALGPMASRSSSTSEDSQSLKQRLMKQVAELRQILGVEKRVKSAAAIVPQGTTATVEQQLLSATQLDAKPMTANSLELQDILFEFCGVGKSQFRRRALEQDKFKEGADRIFGRVKKLPLKSSLFQGFSKDGNQQQTSQNSEAVAAKQSNFELVKVIGLEPEKVFKSLDKYVVKVHKMPKFSNVFDSYESFVPGLGGSNLTTTALPGANTTHGPTGTSISSFARQDGRAVISLNFNPYDLDTKQKKKIYDGAVKELTEHRNQQIKTISQAQRDKQEQAALRRAWVNIAKKDIPKAYRAYQKYKSDQKTNNKKLSLGCTNEVKKKAVRTQRNAKECVMRAKKLTREMLSFWKRRDKELADMKRKKEKFDKEQKRKQAEVEEALLQKKRLEYLMKQSEIYAHFMANKMGMNKEMKQEKDGVLEEEKKSNYHRVEVDESNARKRMAKMINEDKKRLKQFDGGQLNDASMLHESQHDEVNEEELDVNRFDMEGPAKAIEQPTILKAQLKHYQLRGLRWLDNLYEQGINGILADEMGLGKTIQAISLMAHIAESKGCWGPFLVVVPVTTLHNWKNELEKFAPALKVLPYWGNAEERKKLSKFLDPKNLTNPAMQIHVLITSYNLITNNPKDQAKLLKIRWQYMILDEAQAIKNNLSRRWKVLLQFNARNRLLLTGTPIQNSMAELWALLHFIMPKLFDNHEQFQEWFSKDIEASSMDKGELNKHQLKRLHAVLKPFMLRRLKRDVEQEIGQKTEIELVCDMTYRQRILYQRIKNKISTRDLFQLEQNKQRMENLMNLVMQFRKVCNHPDLFERQIGRNPLVWKDLAIGVQQNPAFVTQPEVRSSVGNPIRLQVPKLIFDECFLPSTNNSQTFTKLIPYEDVALSQVAIDTHLRFFNIFNPENLHREFLTSGSNFGILRLMAASNKWGVSEVANLFTSDDLMRTLALIHFHKHRHTRNVGLYLRSNEDGSENEIPVNYHTSKDFGHDIDLDLQIIDFAKRDKGSLFYREQKIVSVIDKSLDRVPPLVNWDPADVKYYSGELSSNQVRTDLETMYVAPVIAESIQIESFGSGTFSRFSCAVKHNPNGKKVLLGDKFKPTRQLNLGRCSNEAVRSTNLPEILQEGVFTMGNVRGTNIVEVPKYGRLVTDCAKMRIFADLVTKLHAQKHRCLVFCQMTRMLDILEDYLTWKKMTFFRMDGQTSIQDRRYMVDEYQRNDNIFAFLLSTRAGGLGVNLIAADTVIFYDNDWNPTMDEQATDRAHRIGQTKPVTVYRIVTRGTVEEKIVKRAKQKQSVQSTVYGDTFKMKDVVQMVMDDEGGDGDDNGGATGGASFIKQKRGGRGNQKKKEQTSPQKAAGQAGKASVKKSRKTARTDDAAQALFDEIDRNEEGEESDEDGPGVTFKMDEFEEAGAKPSRGGGGGAKKQGDDDDHMVDEY